MKVNAVSCERRKERKEEVETANVTQGKCRLFILRGTQGHRFFVYFGVDRAASGVRRYGHRGKLARLPVARLRLEFSDKWKYAATGQHGGARWGSRRDRH